MILHFVVLAIGHVHYCSYTVVLNGKQALTAALVRPDFSDRTPYYGELVYSNVKNMGEQPLYVD